MRPKIATAGNESADPYDRFYAIKDKRSLQVRKARCSKKIGLGPLASHKSTERHKL